MNEQRPPTVADGLDARRVIAEHRAVYDMMIRGVKLWAAVEVSDVSIRTQAIIKRLVSADLADLYPGEGESDA